MRNYGWLLPIATGNRGRHKSKLVSYVNVDGVTTCSVEENSIVPMN